MGKPKLEKPKRSSREIGDDLRRAIGERDKAHEKEAARTRQLEEARMRLSAAKRTVARLKKELDEAMGAGR